MAIITLDSVSGIKMDTDSPGIANLHALSYLPIGIFNLANEVRRFEINMAMGIDFPIAKPDMLAGPVGPNFDIVACCFGWYSISITNYLRLVALVKLVEINQWKRADISDAKNFKTIKKFCSDYVRDVCPDIYIWRNKVAAHFAITDPFHDDNLGALEYSSMNQVVYMNPYYYVGASQWVTAAGESNFPKWALTETFEKLAPRLWPEAVLPKIPD